MDSSNYHYLKLSSKVYIALHKIDKAKVQMQKINDMFGDNLEIRRNYVEFLKEHK